MSYLFSSPATFQQLCFEEHCHVEVLNLVLQFCHHTHLQSTFGSFVSRCIKTSDKLESNLKITQRFRQNFFGFFYFAFCTQMFNKILFTWKIRVFSFVLHCNYFVIFPHFSRILLAFIDPLVELNCNSLVRRNI